MGKLTTFAEKVFLISYSKWVHFAAENTCIFLRVLNILGWRYTDHVMKVLLDYLCTKIWKHRSASCVTSPLPDIGKPRTSQRNPSVCLHRFTRAKVGLLHVKHAFVMCHNIVCCFMAIWFTKCYARSCYIPCSKAKGWNKNQWPPFHEGVIQKLAM